MDIYPIYLKYCNKCNTAKSIDNFNEDTDNHTCHSCLSSDNRNSKVDNWLSEYHQNKKDAMAYKRAETRRYIKKREEENPLIIIIKITRSVLRSAIRSKGYKINSRTHEILGCTYEEFKVHIENQFDVGMSWDNHGEWHIDHIIPVSYGVNEIEIIALNNYINLQPLWAKENLRKGNRYIG